jgi:predicted nucleic acid-binding protein
MIVVADTGPLNYLVLTGAVGVLQPLYVRVIAPQTVVEELKVVGAPAAGITDRVWALAELLAPQCKPPIWGLV